MWTSDLSGNRTAKLCGSRAGQVYCGTRAGSPQNLRIVRYAAVWERLDCSEINSMLRRGLQAAPRGRDKDMQGDRTRL